MRETKIYDLRFAPSPFPAAGLEVARLSLPKTLAESVQVVRHRLKHHRQPDQSPMHLFDADRVIFVRTPKNASNSIMASLYPGVRPSQLPHFSADYFRRVFPRKFAAYLVFSPIRHPLDRFASAFTYYRETSTQPAERRLMDVELPFLKSLEDFVHWLNDQPDLSQAPIMRWHHFHKQTRYVCDGRGRVIVDMMFPVEDMQAGMAHLANVMGRRPVLARLNTTTHHPFDRLPMDRISRFYGDDLQLWQSVMDAKVWTRPTTLQAISGSP